MIKVEVRTSEPITPSQMREGRLLLGWSRERLAALSETTVNFVMKYEDAGHVAQLRSCGRSFNGLAAVCAVLLTAGVEFTNGDAPGVRLRERVTPP